MSKVVGTLP